MDGERMFSLVKKLDFVRLSGTQGEKRASEIIRAECERLGVNADTEPFTTLDGVVSETKLEVTASYIKSYSAAGYLRSASIDAELSLVYAEDGLEGNLCDVRGKAIILNNPVNKKNYAALIKAAPACVLTGDVDCFDREDESDLAPGMLRPSFADAFEERLCAVTLRKRDLFELISRGASSVRVKVVSRDTENTSRNVTAFIPGGELPQEIICFTAHMDSVRFSHGCYDNASGSAIMLEIMRHFALNPPRRSMRFIWTGSEERGLLGSRYYVEAHADEVARTCLNINLDLAGCAAGHEFAIVTGPKELTAYFDEMMKREGFAVETKTDIYSSDCVSYADKGVPAISIGRAGARGMSYIHDRRDTIDFVSAAALKKTASIAYTFARQIDAASEMPFERKIPEDIVKKIDEYLLRKETNKK